MLRRLFCFQIYNQGNSLLSTLNRPSLQSSSTWICTTNSKPNRLYRCYTTSTMALPSRETILATPFPDSVELATTILQNREQSGTLSASAGELIPHLVSTSAGARGLFVALLTDESESALPSDDIYIVQALSKLPTEMKKTAAVLCVKNVVMSGTMIETYKRNNQPDLEHSSTITCKRAQTLLSAWHLIDPNAVIPIATEMVRAFKYKQGEFESFRSKWGYDETQCKMGITKLEETLGELVCN